MRLFIQFCLFKYNKSHYLVDCSNKTVKRISCQCKYIYIILCEYHSKSTMFYIVFLSSCRVFFTKKTFVCPHLAKYCMFVLKTRFLQDNYLCSWSFCGARAQVLCFNYIFVTRSVPT